MTNNRWFIFDTNVLISAFLFSQSKPVSGKVECIVTGDDDLLVLKSFRGVEILTAQEFLTKN